jgi:hypothetical protein
MGRSCRLLLGALGVLILGAVFAAPAFCAPAGPWFKLGAEDQGSYRWSVRTRPSAGGDEPCLLVAAIWRSGPLEYHRSTDRDCAPSGALREPGPPLIVGGAQPSTGASVQKTAIGMIFAPSARRVRIEFAGGRTESIRLRKFSSAQGEDLKMGPFSYAAFAIDGEWCAERLTSLNAGGGVLWDSGVDPYQCGATGEPSFSSRPNRD